jgi:hypothetical protein
MQSLAARNFFLGGGEIKIIKLTFKPFKTIFTNLKLHLIYVINIWYVSLFSSILISLSLSPKSRVSTCAHRCSWKSYVYKVEKHCYGFLPGCCLTESFPWLEYSVDSPWTFNILIR